MTEGLLVKQCWSLKQFKSLNKDFPNKQTVKSQIRGSQMTAPQAKLGQIRPPTLQVWPLVSFKRNIQRYDIYSVPGLEIVIYLHIEGALYAQKSVTSWFLTPKWMKAKNFEKKLSIL